MQILAGAHQECYRQPWQLQRQKLITTACVIVCLTGEQYAICNHGQGAQRRMKTKGKYYTFWGQFNGLP